MLTNQQKAVLHVMKQKLGWDDARYRDVLRAHAGAESSNDMNYEGFMAVMKFAKSCGFEKRQRGRMKYEELGERPGMALPSQLRMIEAMWRNVARFPTDEALNKFLNNKFGVRHLTWLDEKKVNQVIMALKAMGKSKND